MTVLCCASGLNLDRNSREWEMRYSLKNASSASTEAGEITTCNATSCIQQNFPLEGNWLAERSHSWGVRDKWNQEKRHEQCSSGADRWRNISRCFLDGRNQIWHRVSHILKALQSKFRYCYFILGSFASSHQSVGLYSPAKKHDSHLAIFIFIVIQ